jgi:formylmethanofuran dehydrogenase subunit C
MITLYPLRRYRFPVTAECISPDAFQDKTRAEIEAMQVWEGNKQRKITELFKCQVKTQDKQENIVITIEGDVTQVRRIGLGMTGGEIIVNGNAGMHLGERMKGGKITVHGNVGGWAGSMMRGGTIEIHGNTSDYLGAPYRGSTEGMRGGRVAVYGNVGNEAGAHMKKGVIKVFGNTGQFAGFRMRGGTIYMQGDCDGRVGACMIDGRIIIGGVAESILPTFTIDSVKMKVKIEEDETAQGPSYVFLGDLAENGKGKLYVPKDKNPHLSHYENLL